MTEDLCVCGPMTRGEGYCECGADPDLKPEDMPGLADRLLRALYLEYAGKDESVRKMLEKLAKLGGREHKRKVRFRETGRGWKRLEPPHG